MFSELNEKALLLASDIKTNHPKAAVVFADVFDDNEESTYELLDKAEKIGAVCFKKDIVAHDFKYHSARNPICFFAIGGNETENLNQSLKLIENYRNRDNTHIL